MRRTRYISLIIALLSLTGIMPASAQQQSQYALYNFRNDGDFNAWLNIDIDSITYSNVGLNGIEYNCPVVQEVWTPDSCYRIPIEVIDSIGFNAPKPEFKDGIFHITEEHLPYAVGVDELTASFSSDIPSSLLPQVGQVVISDVYEGAFEDGFAGRVLKIVTEDGTTRIECEEVGLGDVYDQLMCVGKSIIYEDDEEHEQSAKAPRKIKINDDGTVEIPLGKFSLQLKDGDIGYMNLNAKPTLNIDYTIVYNIKGAKDQFRLVARPRMDFSIDYGVQVKKKRDLDDYLGFIPIETSIPGVRIKLRWGAFLDLSGSVALEGTINYAAECSAGFDSNIDDNHGFFFENWSGWTKDPEVKIKMDGSIFMGPAIQVFAYVIYEKGFPSVKFTVKPGLEFSGHFEASTDGFTEEYGYSTYDMLKDSKLTLGAKLKATASANFFGTKFELPSYTLSPEWARFDWYLFPNFTKPELQNWKYARLTPTALYSEVTRKTLFTTKLGMAVYDVDDNELARDMSFGIYKEKTGTTYLGHDMHQYSPGTYSVRPIVNVLGIDFKATPIASFTVPQSLSLESNTFSLPKNRGGKIYYEGGWGDYSVFVFDKRVCGAVLKNDGLGKYIQVSGLKKGSTTITLKDLRTKEDKPVLVTVTDEQPFVDLALSTNELSLHEGGTATVEITSGNGIYAVASSDENILTATLYNNTIAVEALSEGNAVVTVTDELSGKSCPIAVEVLRYADLFISANDFTLQEGASATVQITSGCGTYTLTNSNEDVVAATLNGNTITIKALKVGNALVTVEDYTSGQTCSIAVTVTAKPDNPEITPGDAIDLGLPSGTLWASCNVGASSPEEYGGYYAWGETEEKDVYNWSTYIHCDGSYKTCHDIGFGDPRKITGTEYDVAHMKLGGQWMIPTSFHYNELMDNCSYERIQLNGVIGDKFTGPNGNSIFLPAAGYRSSDKTYSVENKSCYWLGELKNYDNYNHNYGAGMEIGGEYPSWGGYQRYEGLPVRPIQNLQIKDVSSCPDDNHPHLIDLGLPHGTLWSCCNVDASSPVDYGGYYAWGETEEKAVYDWNTYSHCDGTVETIHNIGSNIGITNYDVAHVKWGGSWQMPTITEIIELNTNSTIIDTQISGVNGIKVIGPNGNSIFLPFTGFFDEEGLEGVDNYVSFWSGTLPRSDSEIGFGKGTDYWNTYTRCDGLTIRPVKILYDKNISSCPNSNHPHMIDLGLPSGTKWACCNVGASEPEENGGYFAWGETEEKDVYDLSNYIYFTGEYGYYGRPLYESLGNISGTQYDVALVKWGGSWKMPSLDQMEEIVNNCSFEWTQFNGVNGGRFTGPNGNSIFLPTAEVINDFVVFGGFCQCYWSSSPYSYYGFNNIYYGGYASTLKVGIKNYKDNNASIGYSDRPCGLVVRPVAE